MGNAQARILRAAWDLLVEDPLGTRMEDVARRAGVSRQAVYLHFSDRSALLVAVARHIDESLGLAEAIRPIQEAPNGLAMLDRMAEFLGEFLPRVNEVSLVLESTALTDEGARAAVADRFENRRGGCRMMATRLKAEGQLAKGLTIDTAVPLLMSLTSIACWRELTLVGGMSRQTYVKHLKRMLRVVLTRAAAPQ
jgi:AcrR family transcriptional regulator